MTGPTQRRRGHAAASARILTAGLSSAAAFGIVAGLAVTDAAGPRSGAADSTALRSEPSVPPAAPMTAPPQAIVVIRRHWVPVPSGNSSPVSAAPVAPALTPLLVTSPARPAQVTPPTPARVAVPQPVPRPVTRTRGS